MPVAKKSVAQRRRRTFHSLFLLALLVSTVPLPAQNTLRLRVMAANLTSGTQQSYETAGIDIFQGLKPDIVAIQEFRYNASTASNDLRTLVNTAFGTNYSFYCEGGSYNIPNGIVSRWPILAAGSLDEPTVSDRGIAWAQIDLPGTNDLYVISVHLYGSGTATDRNTEAMVVTNFIATNCPPGAWVVVGGDFNTGSRTESCVTTLKTLLSDQPIPDDNGSTPDQDTNEPRNKPYDYVLPSFALTNYQTSVVLPSHTLPNGLVFDSAIYTPLSDVSPVNSGDSHVSGMQHMGVVKDFLIPTNNVTTSAPSISVQPQSQTIAPGSNATFSVTASGTAPLTYKWLFNSTNVVSTVTNSYSITNAQPTNAGAYLVIITNAFGNITSSVALLTVTNPPTINTGAVVTLAGWDTSAQANYGTSPLAPTTNALGLTVGGLTRGNGVTTLNTAAARTWGGNGFDATSEANAIAAADYVTFSFTNSPGYSVSYTAISQYDYKRSNSGPPNGVLQYQIGSDAFTDVATFSYTSTAGASLGPIDLSTMSALQNVTNPVTFRIVNYGASTSGGNWYLYDLSSNTAPDLAVQGTINAIATNAPAIPAILTSPATVAGNQFQFTVTGTAGSNYIVQASTDLSASNWISIFTNVSPFTYADTNASTAPLRFYRVVAP